MPRPALLFLALAACSESTAKEQSFAEGMEQLCRVLDAPSVRDSGRRDQPRIASEWVTEHVTNAEVRALFESFVSAPPAERQIMLTTAMKRAGVSACGFADWERFATPSFNVPEVGDAALAPLPEKARTLVVTSSSLLLEGEPLDFTRLATSAAGLARLDGLNGASRGCGSLLIAASPDTRFDRVFAAVAAVSSTYPNDVVLLARNGDELGGVAVAVGPRTERSCRCVRTPDCEKTNPRLAAAVAISIDEIVVSVAEVHRRPVELHRQSVETPATALRPSLKRIVRTEALAQAERSPAPWKPVKLLVMIDPAQTADVVIPALAVAAEYFPDPTLRIGFE